MSNRTNRGPHGKTKMNGTVGGQEEKKGTTCSVLEQEEREGRMRKHPLCLGKK